MTIVLVDSGLQSAGALSGVLNWGSAVDGFGNEMAYDGGGQIFANINGAECSNYWNIPASGSYQYVEMAWNQDLGVIPFEYFAALWVCLDTNVGFNYTTGYRALFFNDGANGNIEVYDYSGFGSSFLNSFLTATFSPGDTLALEYDDVSQQINVYQNGALLGSVPDAAHLGNQFQAIGSYSSSAEFIHVYMEQPSSGGPWVLLPSGIPTSQAFGTPTVKKLVSTTGIATAQAMGVPTVKKTDLPTGIASGQALGVPQLNKVVAPSGIPSGQALGAPTIIGGAGATVTGRDLPLLGAGR